MYQGTALEGQLTPAQALRRTERKAALKSFAFEVLYALATASVVIPLTVWLLLEAIP